VSMKWGVPVAYAHGFEDFEHHDLITPDLAQGVGECAPTSAANGLISLIREYQKAYIIDDREMVGQLRDAMKWDREDGVLEDNFVPGVDAWTRAHSLPIESTRVGDVNGRTTLEAVRRTIDDGSGGAAEIHIKFFSQDSKVVGGHMFSIVAVRYEGDNVYIDVKDPRTPEGVDTYKMNGNIISGYPFDGLAVVSWGFAHVWDTHLAGEE
jgi:hypothetical protein